MNKKAAGDAGSKLWLTPLSGVHRGWSDVLDHAATTVVLNHVGFVVALVVLNPIALGIVGDGAPTGALLSREAFGRWALDFLTFGNGYLERHDSMLRRSLQLKPVLAKYVRRGADLDSYFQVLNWKEEHAFDPGTVFHLLEPDINQEVYGLPQYLGALQSAWLNESATLFRRKYYNNGSHAGFILYMTDPGQNEEDIDALQEAMKNAKGPGNFRNLFIYAPGGKKDGLQLIPVSEVAAKDDFFNIKNVSRDDLLAAHRIPPQLMGIVPSNAGGFGSITQAAEVYAINELAPLQRMFQQLNEWMGEEVVRFDNYALPISKP